MENAQEFNDAKCKYVEKEVDMGFYENFLVEQKKGQYLQNGCTRISHCRCNCNDCVFSRT